MALRRRGRPAGVELFPGFADISEIGTGSLATVYRARELGTNRHVALKLLNVRDASPRAVESFERESVALGALSSHPNIVTLFRTFRVADGRPVLVLELCGSSVADRLQSGGRIPVQEAVSVAIKVAGALETAHRAAILHRDVKPQNILITEFGEPALADFGVAMLQSSTQTTAGLFDFTTLHAAPELLEGGETSAATDVYELASSLYQLIAGQSAFRSYDGESPASVILRILRDPVKPVTMPDVPVQLSDLLIWAMSKEKDARPPTAAEFAAELSQIEVTQGWPRTQFLIRDDAFAAPAGMPVSPVITRLPERSAPRPAAAAPLAPAPAPQMAPWVAPPVPPPAAAMPPMPPPPMPPPPMPPPPMPPPPMPPPPGPPAAPMPSGLPAAPPLAARVAPPLPNEPLPPPPASPAVAPLPPPAGYVPQPLAGYVPQLPPPAYEPPPPAAYEPPPPAAYEPPPPAAYEPPPPPVVEPPAVEPAIIEPPAVQPPDLWAGSVVEIDEMDLGLPDDLLLPPSPRDMPAAAVPSEPLSSPAAGLGSTEQAEQPAPSAPPQAAAAQAPATPQPPAAQAPVTPPAAAAQPPHRPPPVPWLPPPPAPREQSAQQPMNGSEASAAPRPASPPGAPADPLGGAEVYPIPPAAWTPVRPPEDVPVFAFRAPPQAAPSGASSHPDLSLDPMSLRPRATLRAGLSAVTMDEHHLSERQSLRRTRIPWSHVYGFEPQNDPNPNGAVTHGVLVAITSRGPVPLKGTRRPAAELPHVHALLDAYRARAQLLANR